MLPENILRSDVLDIIFEYRNKSYGAYELRKQYSMRLRKALAGVSVLVILLMLMNQLKPQPVLATTIMLSSDTLVNIKSVDPPKPDEPPPPKEAPKPIASVDFQTIRIVPNEEVVDTIPTMDQAEKAIISNITVAGDASTDVVSAAVQNATGVAETPKELPQETVAEVLMHAEKMPLYPGGIENFKKFMLRNLAQPDDLQEGEKIIVIAKFIVKADGTIDEATISKTGRADLDKEVLRVIRKMPSWEPGMQNGRAVAVWFQLPVTFVSSEN